MKVKRCLIVDTETTGVDQAKDHVIEIGAILYSVELNTALVSVSMLLPSPSAANPAYLINKISEGSLEDVAHVDFAATEEAFASMLTGMASLADVFVAHKASFDRGFLIRENAKLWSSRPWVCTKEDFLFDEGKQGDSLVNIALAHNIGVSHNHRALTDCALLARVFGSYEAEDLQALFEHALLPRSPYVAITEYRDREIVKSAGFSWLPEKKFWWKKMTEAEAEAVVEEYKLKLRKVEPEAVGL